MKNMILGFVIAMVALLGCESKEKEAALQNKVDSLNLHVDSLNLQLLAHLEVEKRISEVGALIDSIDESRHVLQLKMIEGNSASDYLARLKNINEYVKSAESKLLELENTSKKSLIISASTIRGLKADLEERSQEIIGLQLQIASLSNANLNLWLQANKKDSILLVRDQEIRLNKNDIANLEKQYMEAQEKNRIATEKNKIAVANLYFDQASAVEEIAERTQFAPRKKKDARMWALDLFKLSQSLGNKEAKARIEKLESKLS